MLMLLYYAAVFLGAFLLFMIQPMMTKALLPAFGGSYLVWGAAMVFFQTALLAGYLLSHVLQGRCGVRRYGLWHLVLLFLPFSMYPFRFASTPDTTQTSLAIGVFWQLLITVGFPFLILSMTSLILQRWLLLSSRPERRHPYVLYAASNAGSVLALLAYPVLLEPLSTLGQQAAAWWIGYGVLVVLHVTVFPWRSLAAHSTGSERQIGEPWSKRIRWFMLSFATGTVLLGTTNVLTFDLAAIPLLWVLPLMLFLLAYVLVFKQRMWCPNWIGHLLNWSVILGSCLVLLLRLRILPPLAVLLVLYLGILFVVCINCNAWLLRHKPSSGHGLTAFYVILATGGLCGSVLVSWIVPLLTHTLLEYPLGLFLALLAIGMAKGERLPGWRAYRVWCWCGVVFFMLLLVPRLLPAGHPSSLVFVWLAVPLALGLRMYKARPLVGALLVLTMMLVAGGLDRFAEGGTVVKRLRNYYGIYHIYDRDGVRYLQHGTTQHGRQALDEIWGRIPMAYYHPSTPVARFLVAERANIRDAAMIGLGTGAVAAYMQADQHLTIFELDPDNLTLAEDYFGYLAQAREQGARVQFVFGDGRLRLASHAPGSFDVLIMDAFNSGSIPVHLLTVEAFQTFMRTLRPDGILLLHLSNRVLDLLSVVYANAAEGGWYAVELSNENDVHPDAEFTVWMALSRDAGRIQGLRDSLGWYGPGNAQLPRPWTDRYSNLPGAIRWFD